MVNTGVKNPELRQDNRRLARHKRRRFHHSEKMQENPDDPITPSLEYAHGRAIEKLKEPRSSHKRARIKIRPLIRSDIKQVLTLARRHGAFDQVPTESALELAPGFPKGFLVGEDDGQVIGFAYGHLREVPAEVLHKWSAKKVGYLSLMAVNPNYRRNGIGEALLQGVLNAMKEAGVDLVLLDCPSEAKEARALYGKLGFTVRAEAMAKRI